MSVSGAPPPLLVWTAATGGGHRGVATAIVEAALRSGARPGTIRTSEPLERASPALRRVLAAYGPLVRHAPLAWGGLFHLTQAAPLGRAVAVALERLLLPALRAELVQGRPRAVLILHPLLVGPAVAARRSLPRGIAPPPLVVLVTDLAGGHRSWIDPGVDWTLTASAAATRWAQGSGTPPDRTVEVGLPVHPDLAGPAPGTRARRALRRALGLDPDRFLVLITGGAEGAGPMAAAASRLLRSGLPIQLAVVCGRNRRLAARLRRWAAPLPIRVAGLVDDMPRWLQAADLVVGKAGPSSVAEAAAAGLPLLVTGALAGQERPNIALVEREGFGQAVTVTGLARAVGQLAAPGSPRYAAMREEARRWGRPRAAFTVAELLGRVGGTPPTG